MFKWLKFIVLLIFGGPLVGIIMWYAMAFLPYLAEIESLSIKGGQSIRSINDKLYPLAIAGETGMGVRSWAIRQAYVSLSRKNKPGGMWTWRLNNLLWLGASYLHFNDHEIFGLWVSCALFTCEREFESVARKTFGKDLTELSEIQLAELVALVKGPSMYAIGSERGEKRARDILEKAHASR